MVKGAPPELAHESSLRQALKPPEVAVGSSIRGGSPIVKSPAKSLPKTRPPSSAHPKTEHHRAAV